MHYYLNGLLSLKFVKTELINIGILLLPSIRSIAYLNTFLDLGIFPDEIILLKGEIPELNKVQEEDKIYKYSDEFFSLDQYILSNIDGLALEVLND